MPGELLEVIGKRIIATKFYSKIWFEDIHGSQQEN